MKTSMRDEDVDAPEHTADTEFSPELSTSGVHGGVELCSLISSLRTLVERQCSTQTVSDTHQPMPNNKSQSSGTDNRDNVVVVNILCIF